MPKIIENLPQRLLEQTKLLVEESGFGAVTIRAVADHCGVGVGTVYNYFESKDALVQAFLLEQWRAQIQELWAVCAAARTPEEVMGLMHRDLVSFGTRHPDVATEEALGMLCNPKGEFHGILVKHLSKPLLRFCDSSYAAEFIASSLVQQTLSGVPFEQSSALLRKLF